MTISSGVGYTFCALMTVMKAAAGSSRGSMQAMLCSAAILAGILALPLTAGAATRNIWLSQADIDALPTNTAAYSRVLAAANGTWPISDISVQENNSASYMMAGALIWRKTGIISYRTRVRDSLMRAVRSCPIRAGVVQNKYSYSPHRFLPGLAVAADLIDLQSFAPDSDVVFRGFMDSVRYTPLLLRNASEGLTINQVFENSAAAGVGAGAARIACSAYVGDTRDLARCDSFFVSYANQSWYPKGTVKFTVGANAGDYFDKGTIGSWVYEPTWICGDTSSWTLISPLCVKTDAEGDTATVDGSIVCQLSRMVSGGPAEPFAWPPTSDGRMYQWTNMNYLFTQSEILYHAGYPDAYLVNGQGLKRVMNMMARVPGAYGAIPQYASANWVAWVANYRYGMNHPTADCTTANWGIYWTDWTHASRQADTIPPAGVSNLASP